MEAQDGNQIERALAFLQRQLATGARPAQDLYELARKEHGISRAMVWLAKKDLGIVDERIGFGRGSVVHWRLPREGTVGREDQRAIEIIQAAVREAVTEWLDVHGEAIITQAVRERLPVTGDREDVL